MIPGDSDWIPLAEAAVRLGCCRRLLARYAAEIPMRVDGYARIHREDIQALEDRWARDRLEAKNRPD